MAPQGHDEAAVEPPSNAQPRGANPSCEDRLGAGSAETSGAPAAGASPRGNQSGRSPSNADDGTHHGGGQPRDHSGWHGQSQIKVTVSTVGTASRAMAGGGAGSSCSSRAGAHDIDGSHPSSFSSTGGVDGSGGGGGKGSERQPADAQHTQICYGLTYFSQAMLQNQKMPVSIPQRLFTFLSFGDQHPVRVCAAVWVPWLNVLLSCYTSSTPAGPSLG